MTTSRLDTAALWAVDNLDDDDHDRALWMSELKIRQERKVLFISKVEKIGGRCDSVL